MQVQAHTKAPTEYFWGDFMVRLKDPGRSQPFASLAAWCRHHNFAYKTVWALINGTYVDGAGPKITAIINQALAEGLIDEIKQAA